MSIKTASYLVQRGNDYYHVKGDHIADRIQSGDKLLVQRDDDHYHVWYGKPSDTDTPYVTRRCRFNNVCDGDQHTDEPGEVNLSYWWGCGSPSPMHEWRNIRNKNVNSFVDLDGEPFALQKQTLISEDSVCRITSDAGWEFWGVIGFTGSGEGLAFKPQYTNDSGRERTDLKIVGVGKKHKPANGEILTFDFFKATSDPFPDMRPDDILIAQDNDGKHWQVSGANFKSLFAPPEPPPGSVAVAISYEFDSGPGGRLEGVSKFFWLKSDGSFVEDPDLVGTVNLAEDDLRKWDGFAFWSEGEDLDDFTLFKDGADFKHDMEFLPWTNTTALVNSGHFAVRAKKKVTGLEHVDTTNWNILYLTFYSSGFDLSGAEDWNTGNIEQIRSVFAGWTADSFNTGDLSNWDLSKVNKLAGFDFMKALPRWLENWTFGPELVTASGIGVGTSRFIGDDLVGDGKGPLDLSGWDVRNIPTRPNSFLVPKNQSANVEFENVIYPIWGTYPYKAKMRAVNSIGNLSGLSFVPINYKGDTFYNKWTGNCIALKLSNFPIDLTDYYRVYSKGTVKITRSDNGNLVYFGYLKEISNVDGFHVIEVDKIKASGGEWPLGVDLDVSIRGMVSPPPLLAEWDWLGYGGDSYSIPGDFCTNTGKAINMGNNTTYIGTKSASGEDQRSAVMNAFYRGTLYYKLNDEPAKSAVGFGNEVISYPSCWFGHGGTQVTNSTTAGGVLRAYDGNPDI